MLLITDRINEAMRLQQTLSSIGPCTLASLDQLKGINARPKVVICDAGLGSTAAVDLLRGALNRIDLRPNTPVVCLLRDPSYLTKAQAISAGATMTLPRQSSPDQLRTQIRALLQAATSFTSAAATAHHSLEEGVAAVQTLLGSFLNDPSDTPSLSPATLKRASDALLSAIENSGVQAWLDVVWTHDNSTFQHCLLVAGLTAAFALELGLPPKARNLLSQAALIHDIGKAQIPREILNKPGKLTQSEMLLMRTHAARGHAMLAGQQSFDPCILDVVRHHHELLDGSGYPDRLQGDQISRPVRMVTICDIYAALVEYRAYKKPMPPEMALAQLESLGDRLDTALLSAFRNVVCHR